MALGSQAFLEGAGAGAGILFLYKNVSQKLEPRARSRQLVKITLSLTFIKEYHFVRIFLNQKSLKSVFRAVGNNGHMPLMNLINSNLINSTLMKFEIVCFYPI